MKNIDGVHPLIQKYLSDSPHTTPEPVLVDLEFAQAIIDATEGNRTLRQYHVEKLARDMENDDFVQTGEPLQISKTGKALNAAHRMHGVITSGKPQYFFISYGLDDEVRKFVEIGVARTPTDAFRMANFRPDPQMHAAVSLLAMNVENGMLPKVELFRQGGGASRWSRAEVLNWGEAHRDVLTAAVAAYGAGSRKPALRGISPAAWVYALYSLRLLDSVERVDEFASSIVNRSTSGAKGDPRLALSDYLTDRVGILSRKGIPIERIHSMRAGEALFITYKAYAAWQNGRKLSANQLAPENGAAIPYPVNPVSAAA